MYLISVKKGVFWPFLGGPVGGRKRPIFEGFWVSKSHVLRAHILMVIVNAVNALIVYRV